MRRSRLQQAWGFSELDMSAVVNAGAVELIEATVEAGASADGARKWWLGELSRRANESVVELDAMPITPSDVAELQGLIDQGTINDKLARQVLEGTLAGEGSPAQVVESRGLAVVSDTARWGRQWTKPSRPTRMWRPRCGTARSRRQARWWVRS